MRADEIKEMLEGMPKSQAEQSATAKRYMDSLEKTLMRDTLALVEKFSKSPYCRKYKGLTQMHKTVVNYQAAIGILTTELLDRVDKEHPGEEGMVMISAVIEAIAKTTEIKVGQIITRRELEKNQ